MAFVSLLIFQTFVKPSSRGSNKLALTERELEIMANTELPAKKEKYRDLFLIGCYLGMRFSDYSSIRKKHFTISLSINLSLFWMTTDVQRGTK